MEKNLWSKYYREKITEGKMQKVSGNYIETILLY